LQPQRCTDFSYHHISPCVLHSPPASFSFIWSPKYLVKFRSQRLSPSKSLPTDNSESPY
jgi:hypothetical protein